MEGAAAESEAGIRERGPRSRRAALAKENQVLSEPGDVGAGGGWSHMHPPVILATMTKE